jgi:acyl-CoA thioesterase-1
MSLAVRRSCVVDRMRAQAAVLLFLFAVTGCRQTARQAAPSASPAATSPATVQTDSSLVPSTDHRPVIVAFGDSLTAGYGTNAGESYPDDLQRALNARGYYYRVVNAGHSGDTSKDGVSRLPDVLDEHPVVAIVAFGGNDGLRGVPLSQTKANLRTIITQFQAAKTKVILGGITLPPNYGNAYIARFNDMYRQLAKDYHVPLLPFMLKDVYGVPGDMQADGIHATAQGNRQVARNFLPYLLPLLHRPAGSGR